MQQEKIKLSNNKYLKSYFFEKLNVFRIFIYYLYIKKIIANISTSKKIINNFFLTILPSRTV